MRGGTCNKRGSCEQVTAALDELACRIRADEQTRSVGAADLRCEYAGEAYWSDGEPLDMWGGELPIKQSPTELFADAALIRHSS